MLSGAAGPMSMMSGGLTQNKCQQNALLNDLLQPPDSAVGAAALIQQDELDAKKRRAAVRYLGTVDCHYWPEASQALKKALRGDRNECVRFEAAVVLGTGCCCTHEIIEALRMSVMGVRGDGFPAETSERVRIAAARSLEHCLSCAGGGASVPVGPPIELIPIDPRDKERFKEKSQAPNPSEYYKKVAEMPREKVVSTAREALAQAQDASSKKVVPLSNPPRSSSIVDIVSNAFSPRTVSATVVSAAPASSSPGTPVSLGASTATTPATTAPPTSAPAVAAAPAAPRQPFFSNLTRKLTGRQDGVAAPAQPGVVVSRDPEPVVSQPLPMPFPEIAPVNTPMLPR